MSYFKFSPSKCRNSDFDQNNANNRPNNNNHNNHNHNYISWFERTMYRANRHFGKTSTFSVLALVMLTHSAIAVLMIYLHLDAFTQTYHGLHSARHDHPNRGKIAIYSRPITAEDADSSIGFGSDKSNLLSDSRIFGPAHSVNLLHSKLIDSRRISHIGWFADHYRWEQRHQCFNNRWTLCDLIFSVKCKQDAIRAVYQYVPMKRRAQVRDLFFSLRATAEQLIEQSQDAFYGLIALITFEDGSDDIFRLKFQYESEAWSLRAQQYRNYSAGASEKSIRSVTVMLACYGYTGTASFTDIRLTSSRAGDDPLTSIFAIGSWCDYPRTAKANEEIEARKEEEEEEKENKISKMKGKNRQSEKSATKQSNAEVIEQKPKIEIIPLRSIISKPDKMDSSKIPDPSASSSSSSSPPLLTFVTQVSMDRLTALERSLRTWFGAISVAIYVPIQRNSADQNIGIQEWQRRYVRKKIAALNISSISFSSIALVPAHAEDRQYPINRLRNVAIEMCRTRFMLLLDADFQPSPELESHFVERFRSKISISQKMLPKFAVIIPAFEYIESPNKYDPILKTKDELIQLIHREDPLVQPFRFFESNEAHRLTDYWRWYTTNEPYNVTRYSDKYEPYIIVEKRDDFPRYDEAFTNYGMNKVIHITELFAANYTFQVLDNAWIIHFPHRITAYYQDFSQNLEIRLRNRAKRFAAIERMIRRYRIRLPECVAKSNRIQEYDDENDNNNNNNNGDEIDGN